MRFSFIKLFLILGVFFIVILLISCSAVDNSTEVVERNQDTSLFDAREVKVGDSINNLVIDKLEVTLIENDYYAAIQFNGEILLSGELIIHDSNNESNEGWGLGNYFQPDEKSSNKIPVLTISPTRYGFTIEDNAKGALKSLPAGTYQATIKIKDYQIWALGKGQENKAELIELLDYKLVEEPK